MRDVENINQEAAARLEAAESALSEQEFKDDEISEDESIAISFLKNLRILSTAEYEKPEFSLKKNGIGFAPLGNITAICSEMKMGKSWLMTQLAAASLCKEGFMGLEPGVNADDTKVLYFDTEQDKYDTKMALRRVQTICHMDYATDSDRLQFYNMRDFDAFDKSISIARNRLKMIQALIKKENPTVVFIDGVRDLIDDFNNLTESADLVQKLMSLSGRYRCCIWSVLHVNPNSDKMRGHLGTEMGNKTTDVFTVKKKKDEVSGTYLFDVKQIAARHRDIDGWTFKINDEGLYALPELVKVGNFGVIEFNDIDEEVQELYRIFSGIEYPPGGLCMYNFRNNQFVKSVWSSNGTIEKKVKRAHELGLLVKFHDEKNIVRYTLKTDNNQTTEK